MVCIWLLAGGTYHGTCISWRRKKYIVFNQSIHVAHLHKYKVREVQLKQLGIASCHCIMQIIIAIFISLQTSKKFTNKCSLIVLIWLLSTKLFCTLKHTSHYIGSKQAILSICIEVYMYTLVANMICTKSNLIIWKNKQIGLVTNMPTHDEVPRNLISLSLAYTYDLWARVLMTSYKVFAITCKETDFIIIKPIILNQWGHTSRN